MTRIKKRHWLDPTHHQHMLALGVKSPPVSIVAHDHDYYNALKSWQRTLPHATQAELHKRALGHLVWQQHNVKEETRVVDHRNELRIIAAILGLILLLLAFTHRAHAQFSRVNYIQFLDKGQAMVRPSEFFSGDELGDDASRADKSLVSLSITPQKDGGHIVSHQLADEVSENGSRITRPSPKRIKFKKGDSFGMLAHVANRLRLPERKRS